MIFAQTFPLLIDFVHPPRVSFFFFLQLSINRRRSSSSELDIIIAETKTSGNYFVTLTRWLFSTLDPFSYRDLPSVTSREGLPAAAARFLCGQTLIAFLSSCVYTKTTKHFRSQIMG